MNTQPEKRSSSIISGTGVVALSDALGFRGMWHRHKPRDMLAALRTAQEQLRMEADWQRHFVGNEVVTVAFSDTILMAGIAAREAHIRNSVPPTNGEIVQDIGSALASMIRNLAGSSLPLIYRGCIAVGNLAIQENFVVGQAVDEAAEWFERSDASLVWLVPSARSAVDFVSNYFFEWPVPLKGGGSLRTLVLNPLWDLARESIYQGVETPPLDDLVSALLAPFDSSNSVDVVRKRQNTEDFLQVAKAYTMDRYAPAFHQYVEEARDERLRAQVDGEADENIDWGDLSDD